MNARTWRIGTALALGVLAGSASGQFWTASGILTEGISNNGIASGSSNGSGHYFMWSAGGPVVDIGGVSPGSGVGGQGRISADGRFVSGTTFNAAMGYHEMSRYDALTGTWTGFGMIPGVGQQVDSEVSSGWGISGDGRSVVGLGWTSLGTVDTHAMQWRDGVGVIDLGSNAIGQSARANGANYDGSVVAGWQDGNGRQGAAWVNGVQELIFTNSGAPAQEAQAVSDDGTYVVGIGVGGFFTPGNAYRYNTVTNVYEALPNLDVGAQRNMAAYDTNADGSIVVGGTWGFGPATLGNGFIWQEGVGTMSVSEYLDSLGVAYEAGYTFNFVSGISSDGQWLTGWGRGADGAGSWIVHIPSPASIGLFGVAGLAAVRRRR
ncbi:MAG: hypothetical protein Kow0022_15820 [Phycisphaerales bacterium]